MNLFNNNKQQTSTNFPVATASFRAFEIKSLYWGIFAAAKIRLGFVVASVGLYFFMATKIFKQFIIKIIEYTKHKQKL